MRNLEFEPLGSAGTAEWGLLGGTPTSAKYNTPQHGFAVPGVSNVPWGLFSVDKFDTLFFDISLFSLAQMNLDVQCVGSYTRSAKFAKGYNVLETS